MSERLRTISVGDCELDINHDMFINSIHSEPSLMNTSQISTSSQDSHRASFSKTPHQIASRGVSWINNTILKILILYFYFRLELQHVASQN